MEEVSDPRSLLPPAKTARPQPSAIARSPPLAPSRPQLTLLLLCEQVTATSVHTKTLRRRLSRVA